MMHSYAPNTKLQREPLPPPCNSCHQTSTGSINYANNVNACKQAAYSQAFQEHDAAHCTACLQIQNALLEP